MCVTPILPELEYSRSSSSAAAGPRTIVAKDGVLYKCKGGRTVSKIALADDGVTVVKATDWAGPMPPSTHLDLAIVVMRGSAKCWTLQARSRAEMEEWYRMILFMNGGDPGASLCPAMPGDGTAHPLPADALWTGLEEGPGLSGRLEYMVKRRMWQDEPRLDTRRSPDFMDALCSVGPILGMDHGKVAAALADADMCVDRCAFAIDGIARRNDEVEMETHCAPPAGVPPSVRLQEVPSDARFSREVGKGLKSKLLKCHHCGSRRLSRSMAALGCGHDCCMPCWVDHVRQTAEAGRAVLAVQCPYHRCRVRLTREALQRFLPQEAQARKWVDGQEAVPCVAWCTGAGCFRLAALDDGPPTADVACACRHSFCAQCGDEVHTPLTCAQARWWRRATDWKGAAQRMPDIRRPEYAAKEASWWRAMVEPCPLCGLPQECSHQELRTECLPSRGGCGHAFCWRCLQPWAEHGHRCSAHAAFESAARVSDGAEGGRAKGFTPTGPGARGVERLCDRFVAESEAARSVLWEADAARADALAAGAVYRPGSLRLRAGAECVARCRAALAWSHALLALLPPTGCPATVLLRLLVAQLGHECGVAQNLLSQACACAHLAGLSSKPVDSASLADGPRRALETEAAPRAERARRRLLRFGCHMVAAGLAPSPEAPRWRVWLSESNGRAVPALGSRRATVAASQGVGSDGSVSAKKTAAEAGAEGAAAGGAYAVWVCPHCSLENAQRRSNCELCGAECGTLPGPDAPANVLQLYRHYLHRVLAFLASTGQPTCLPPSGVGGVEGVGDRAGLDVREGVEEVRIEGGCGVMFAPRQSSHAALDPLRVVWDAEPACPMAAVDVEAQPVSGTDSWGGAAAPVKIASCVPATGCVMVSLEPLLRALGGAGGCADVRRIRVAVTRAGSQESPIAVSGELEVIRPTLSATVLGGGGDLRSGARLRVRVRVVGAAAEELTPWRASLAWARACGSAPHTQQGADDADVVVEATGHSAAPHKTRAERRDDARKRAVYSILSFRAPHPPSWVRVTGQVWLCASLHSARCPGVSVDVERTPCCDGREPKGVVCVAVLAARGGEGVAAGETATEGGSETGRADNEGVAGGETPAEGSTAAGGERAAESGGNVAAEASVGQAREQELPREGALVVWGSTVRLRFRVPCQDAVAPGRALAAVVAGRDVVGWTCVELQQQGGAYEVAVAVGRPDKEEEEEAALAVVLGFLCPGEPAPRPEAKGFDFMHLLGWPTVAAASRDSGGGGDSDEQRLPRTVTGFFTLSRGALVRCTPSLALSIDGPGEVAAGGSLRAVAALSLPGQEEARPLTLAGPMWFEAEATDGAWRESGWGDKQGGWSLRVPLLPGLVGGGEGTLRASYPGLGAVQASCTFSVAALGVDLRLLRPCPAEGHSWAGKQVVQAGHAQLEDERARAWLAFAAAESVPAAASPEETRRTLCRRTPDSGLDHTTRHCLLPSSEVAVEWEWEGGESSVGDAVVALHLEGEGVDDGELLAQARLPAAMGRTVLVVPEAPESLASASALLFVRVTVGVGQGSVSVRSVPLPYVHGVQGVGPGDVGMGAVADPRWHAPMRLSPAAGKRCRNCAAKPEGGDACVYRPVGDGNTLLQLCGECVNAAEWRFAGVVRCPLHACELVLLKNPRAVGDKDGSLPSGRCGECREKVYVPAAGRGVREPGDAVYFCLKHQAMYCMSCVGRRTVIATRDLGARPSAFQKRWTRMAAQGAGHPVMPDDGRFTDGGGAADGAVPVAGPAAAPWERAPQQAAQEEVPQWEQAKGAPAAAPPSATGWMGATGAGQAPPAWAGGHAAAGQTGGPGFSPPAAGAHPYTSGGVDAGEESAKAAARGGGQAAPSQGTASVGGQQPAYAYGGAHGGVAAGGVSTGPQAGTASFMGQQPPVYGYAQGGMTGAAPTWSVPQPQMGFMFQTQVNAQREMQATMGDVQDTVRSALGDAAAQQVQAALSQAMGSLQGAAAQGGAGWGNPAAFSGQNQVMPGQNVFFTTTRTTRRTNHGPFDGQMDQ